MSGNSTTFAPETRPTAALYTGPTADDLARIPAELHAPSQWVLWRGIDKIDKHTGEIIGLDKIPIDAQTLRNASVSDPATWNTFAYCTAALATALEEWEHGNPAAYRGGGIGFVFTKQDNYFGLDTDKCRNPATGEIEPWALSHLQRLDTYTEVSQSRTGLHGIGKGTLPPGGRRKERVELYDAGRFFVVTGWHIEGLPVTIEPRQEALDALHADIFGSPQPPQSPSKTQTSSPLMDDAKLLARARKAQNKDKFNQLWNADSATLAYLSQSEADMALCTMLAFWTQDPVQIDRLFRQSKLWRDKWDEQHGAQTYGQLTIAKAQELQTEHYGSRARLTVASQEPAPQQDPGQEDGGLKFKCTKDGRPRPVTSNVEAVFQHDPRWQGVLALDELANDVMLLKRPPYLLNPDPWQPRALRDWDVAETSIWLQRAYDLCLTTNAVGEVIEMYAARFAYHVVRDYLNSLTWDHTPRLDRWLMTYCHAPDTAYTHAVGRNTLIAAVARVMQPGCKVDTVCILEGEQGTFKSTVWRTLASDAWFSDTMPVNLADKDAAQSLRGKWIIELGELAAMRHNEKEVLKRFVSSPSDHYRPSYGRRAASFPRMSVFVGTTNQHEIFDDDTGNRRYWPVPVTGLCDIAALERDRDQLWAEALDAFRQGSAWHLTPEEELEAIAEQEARMEVDPWEDRIMNFLEFGNYTKITTDALFKDALQFYRTDLWTRANRNRVGRILRQHGWKADRVSTAVGGQSRQVRGFVREKP